MHQAHRGSSLAGVLLCRSAHRALKGALWVGSYSVVQYLRCLMGQPLCSAAMLAFGEREAMVMASPTTRDSAVLPCFHGCLAVLHRHFPPQSPPSHPLNLSLCSQQQPCPGIGPQSLNSSSPLLRLPADLCPCLGCVWLWQGLSNSHFI